LAEEYDVAQDRGEVASFGANQHTDEGVAAANTLGIRRDEIHEARKIRDAERDDPGIIGRTTALSSGSSGSAATENHCSQRQQ